MAKSYGNVHSNIFVVSNAVGYDAYDGLGGNDTYNVNPILNENITISDGQGVNSIVLGNSDIASTMFFKIGSNIGARLTYKSGGELTVTGGESNFQFIFGGGQNSFDAVQGGKALTFSEMVTAFGITTQLGSTPTNGTISGVLQSDGTILASQTGGDGILMSNGGTYEATNGTIDIFVYEFSDYSGGSYGAVSMAGRDGIVRINGFNPAEDIIRFVDTDGTPPTLAEFQNGYTVTPDAFSNKTTVSLAPYSGENGNSASVASDIILQGVILEKPDITIQVA